ncbi:MAG: hypothetical protein R3C59_10675 [Planctomycetaceae bacterium]
MTGKRRIVQKEYVSGSLDQTRHLYYTQPSKWQVVEERIDSSTDPDHQFVWGQRYIDDLILRDRDTTGNGTLDERLYALQDANWNVTSIIDTAGTVQQRFNYDAYGMPEFLTSGFVASTNTKDFEVLYAGYRLENATTLFHVRRRSLNSVLGCWVQRDPIGYAGGINLHAAYFILNGLDPIGTSLCTDDPPACPQDHGFFRPHLYGCFCGPDHPPAGGPANQPIDPLDRSCKDHDDCYGQNACRIGEGY